MRRQLMAAVLGVYAAFGATTAQADESWAAIMRLEIVEAKVTAVEGRVGAVEAQLAALTATLARIEAKLAPAVASAPSSFTPAALSYVSGDCPGGNCPAQSSTRRTSALPVAAANTSWTASPAGAPTYTGACSTGQCGNTSYGSAPRRGPVRRLLGGLFGGGCGG